MEYNKNADTFLFLLLFTTGQREKKILQKHYLWVQALKNGEKQRVLGEFYPSIYQILSVNFQQNLYLRKVHLSYFQLRKKLKTISLKVFKITYFKTYNKRLQRVLWDLKMNSCNSPAISIMRP